MCRLRHKLAFYSGSGAAQNSSGALGVRPGRADLTLKLKDVDPQNMPTGLGLIESEPDPELLGADNEPHLKTKVGRGC